MYRNKNVDKNIKDGKEALARAQLAPKVRAREVGMSALVNTTSLKLDVFIRLLR